MSVIQFKRHHLVDEIIDALRDENTDITEAIVIGKKNDGTRFTFMTGTDNIPELIGYLEAVKTDLVIEMITQAEHDDD